MKTLLWIALGGVGLWLVYQIFFRPRTDLEQHMDELTANRKLGDIAANTVIAIDPIISYLGREPLAGESWGISNRNTQSAIPVVEAFPQGNDGVPQYWRLYADDYTPSTKSAATDGKVYPGAQDVFGLPFLPAI